MCLYAGNKAQQAAYTDELSFERRCPTGGKTGLCSTPFASGAGKTAEADRWKDAPVMPAVVYRCSCWQENRKKYLKNHPISENRANSIKIGLRKSKKSTYYTIERAGLEESTG